MSKIQSVELQEFQANLHKYTTPPQQSIVVTSNGKAVGYFISAQESLSKDQLETLEKSHNKLTKMLEESGVTEEEIVTEFKTLRKEKQT